jgi:hypothetical protein
MQDGTVIPVQVDAQGRLVAEGLQGAAGPAGPAGPAGGAFPLPADPQEGNVLAWLSGQLKWTEVTIGSKGLPSYVGYRYLPASYSASDPYVIDCTSYSMAADHPKRLIDTLKCTGTGITITNAQGAESFSLDLRDFLHIGLHEITVGGYAWPNHAGGVVLLDERKQVIAGTYAPLPSTSGTVNVPIVAGARLLRVGHWPTGYSNLSISAVRVNGVPFWGAMTCLPTATFVTQA